MQTTKLMCAPLYNDMAAVFFGVYENEDRYKQYALFVVNITLENMIVFSSVEYDGKEGQSVNSRKWIKEYGIMELIHQSILKHIPYITVFQTPDWSEKQIENQLKKFLASYPMNNMGSPICWSVRNRTGLDTYIVVFRNLLLSTTPEIVDVVAAETREIWREFFGGDISNQRPPNVSVNSIIETKYVDPSVAPLLGIISKISSMNYEKTQSKGSVVVTRNQAGNMLIPVGDIEFSMENTRHIRKLLEMTDQDRSLLVEDGKIYGIGKPDNPEYKVQFSGHFEWEIRDKDGEPFLRCKHGNYYVPISIEMRDWYVNNRTQKLPPQSKAMVNSLLNVLYSTGRGAILVISDEAKDEAKRLCGKKRGLQIGANSQFGNITQSALAHSPQNRMVDLNLDIIQNNGEVTKALATIDGAILIDTKGACHAIGIILDGDIVIDGTPARGSRYNSTKNYVARRTHLALSKGVKSPKIYAVILSDDGYIDIIASQDKEVLEACNAYKNS